MAASAQVLPFPGRARGRSEDDEKGPRRPVSKLKKQFTNAVAAKIDENAESARRSATSTACSGRRKTSRS